MGVPYQVSRSAHGLDVSFMESALCRAEGHRRDIFFAEMGRSASERVMAMEARSVCARCPVVGDCFQYAVAAEEHGIWGGTTRDERLHYVRYGRLPGPKPLRRKRDR
jgi:WhiB family redox-sensing transcriptional regulator